MYTICKMIERKDIMSILKKAVRMVILILLLLVLLISNMLFGANREKKEYKGINDEEGYIFFHSYYGENNLDSITDIYKPKEAIARLGQMQKDLNEEKYGYYQFANISYDKIDNITVVGKKALQTVGKRLIAGKLIDGQVHITDMKHIEIPALISEDLKKEYPLGSKVDTTMDRITITYVIRGIVKSETEVKPIEGLLDGLIIPSLQFDVEPKNAEEENLQEWFLTSTIQGYIHYSTFQEYKEATQYYNKVAKKAGLKWKSEPRAENRYEGTAIPLNEAQANWMRMLGCVGMMILALVEIRGVRNRKNSINEKYRDKVLIDAQTRIVILVMLKVIVLYAITLIGIMLALKNSIYYPNLMSEKGNTLAVFLLYGIVQAVVSCKWLKRERRNHI